MMNIIKYVALGCMLSQLPNAVGKDAVSQKSASDDTDDVPASGYPDEKNMKFLDGPEQDITKVASDAKDAVNEAGKDAKEAVDKTGKDVKKAMNETDLTPESHPSINSLDKGVYFKAIKKDENDSHYQLDGEYGVNELALIQQPKPFISLRISGDKIEDGSLVQTWVQIQDQTYDYDAGNSTHKNMTTHHAKDGYEFMECNVKVDDGYDHALVNNVYVNSYEGSDAGIENADTKNPINAWGKSEIGIVVSKYQSRYPLDNKTDLSVVCYADRNSNLEYDEDEVITLRNNIKYPVVVGYRIWKPSQLEEGDDTPFQFKAGEEKPYLESVSDTLHFTWTTIQGATSLSLGLALMASLLAFN